MMLLADGRLLALRATIAGAVVKAQVDHADAPGSSQLGLLPGRSASLNSKRRAMTVLEPVRCREGWRLMHGPASPGATTHSPSLSPSLTRSLTHSPSLSLTHSLTHSLTRWHPCFFFSLRGKKEREHQMPLFFQARSPPLPTRFVSVRCLPLCCQKDLNFGGTFCLPSSNEYACRGFAFNMKTV